jgi:hypothetical protein
MSESILSYRRKTAQLRTHDDRLRIDVGYRAIGSRANSTAQALKHVARRELGVRRGARHPARTGRISKTASIHWRAMASSLRIRCDRELSNYGSDVVTMDSLTPHRELTEVFVHELGHHFHSGDGWWRTGLYKTRRLVVLQRKWWFDSVRFSQGVVPHIMEPAMSYFTAWQNSRLPRRLPTSVPKFPTPNRCMKPAAAGWEEFLAEAFSISRGRANLRPERRVHVERFLHTFAESFACYWRIFKTGPMPSHLRDAMHSRKRPAHHEPKASR